MNRQMYDASEDPSYLDDRLRARMLSDARAEFFAMEQCLRAAARHLARAQAVVDDANGAAGVPSAPPPGNASVRH
ncbi:MAG TPA: hypothetical protein VH475_00645 [Tepidisphaeraceae bacterium]